jgi:hypothetical protein
MNISFKKKSQITVFIIVGILMLVVSVMLYYFSNISRDTRTDYGDVILSYDFAQPIYNQLNECFSESGDYSLYHLSMRGGYYDVPLDSALYLWYDVPYYYHYEKGNIMPSLKNIETEIEKALKNSFFECAQNIIEIYDDVEINFNSLSFEVDIIENYVLFDTIGDIKVKKGDLVHTIKGLSFDIRSNLNQHYDIAKRIVEFQENNPNYVRIGHITEIGYFEKIYIGLYYADNYVVYRTLINLTHSDEEYDEFLFAVKYNWVEESSFSSKEIINFDLYVGYPFEYNLLANKRYNVYSNLFSVSDDGLISFTPLLKDKGRHKVLIVDEDNNILEMNLNIISDNSAPKIDKISDILFNKSIDSVFRLKVNATDLDDDKIFYNIASSLDMSIGTLNGQIVHDFSAIDVGLYGVSIIVTDINGESAIENFNIRVIE